MPNILSLIRRLIPALAPISMGERVRAALGVLLAVLFTGLVGRLLPGGTGVPLLIAPIAASAVLLIALPTSPLAQPWSIIGGNVISTAIGVTCALYVPDPVVAAALASGLSIAVMTALKCLHPPSAALALMAVLGGDAVREAGYGLILWPVLVDTLLLVVAALVFNNLTGKRYPHLVPVVASNPHRTADRLPMNRLGVTTEDIAAALAQYDLVVPVATDDLEDILHKAELRAYDRRSGGVTCADIMSRDVQSVGPKTSLRTALKHLREHHIKALPVVDKSRKVVGILTQTDLLDKAEWGLQRQPRGRVEEVMSAPVKAALPETHIAQLVPAMADAGLHHLPVVDDAGLLVGMVTQSDVVAALFAVGQPAVAEPAE